MAVVSTPPQRDEISRSRETGSVEFKMDKSKFGEGALSDSTRLVSVWDLLSARREETTRKVSVEELLRAADPLEKIEGVESTFDYNTRKGLNKARCPGSVPLFRLARPIPGKSYSAALLSEGSEGKWVNGRFVHFNIDGFDLDPESEAAEIRHSAFSRQKGLVFGPIPRGPRKWVQRCAARAQYKRERKGRADRGVTPRPMKTMPYKRVCVSWRVSVRRFSSRRGSGKAVASCAEVTGLDWLDGPEAAANRQARLEGVRPSVVAPATLKFPERQGKVSFVPSSDAIETAEDECIMAWLKLRNRGSAVTLEEFEDEFWAQWGASYVGHAGEEQNPPSEYVEVESDGGASLSWTTEREFYDVDDAWRSTFEATGRSASDRMDALHSHIMERHRCQDEIDAVQREWTGMTDQEIACWWQNRVSALGDLTVGRLSSLLLDFKKENGCPTRELHLVVSKSGSVRFTRAFCVSTVVSGLNVWIHESGGYVGHCGGVNVSEQGVEMEQWTRVPGSKEVSVTNLGDLRTFRSFTKPIQVSHGTMFGVGFDAKFETSYVYRVAADGGPSFNMYRHVEHKSGWKEDVVVHDTSLYKDFVEKQGVVDGLRASLSSAASEVEGLRSEVKRLTDKIAALEEEKRRSFVSPCLTPEQQWRSPASGCHPPPAPGTYNQPESLGTTGGAILDTWSNFPGSYDIGRFDGGSWTRSAAGFTTPVTHWDSGSQFVGASVDTARRGGALYTMARNGTMLAYPFTFGTPVTNSFVSVTRNLIYRNEGEGQERSFDTAVAIPRRPNAGLGRRELYLGFLSDLTPMQRKEVLSVVETPLPTLSTRPSHWNRHTTWVSTMNGDRFLYAIRGGSVWAYNTTTNTTEVSTTRGVSWGPTSERFFHTMSWPAHIYGVPVPLRGSLGKPYDVFPSFLWDDSYEKIGTYLHQLPKAGLVPFDTGLSSSFRSRYRRAEGLIELGSVSSDVLVIEPDRSLVGWRTSSSSLQTVTVSPEHSLLIHVDGARPGFMAPYEAGWDDADQGESQLRVELETQRKMHRDCHVEVTRNTVLLGSSVPHCDFQPQVITPNPRPEGKELEDAKKELEKVTSWHDHQVELRRGWQQRASEEMEQRRSAERELDQARLDRRRAVVMFNPPSRPVRTEAYIGDRKIEFADMLHSIDATPLDLTGEPGTNTLEYRRWFSLTDKGVSKLWFAANPERPEGQKDRGSIMWLYRRSEPECQELFQRARDSTMADIEENPGPPSILARTEDWQMGVEIWYRSVSDFVTLPHGCKKVEPFWLSMTCCSTHPRYLNLIIGEGPWFWIELSWKDENPGASWAFETREWALKWIAKEHGFNTGILPFLSSRGPPLLATYPWHAHGWVVDVSKPMSLRNVEILVPPFVEPVIPRDRWNHWSCRNRRSYHTGTDDVERVCTECRQMQLLHDGRCGECWSMELFPQASVRPEDCSPELLSFLIRRIERHVGGSPVMCDPNLDTNSAGFLLSQLVSKGPFPGAQMRVALVPDDSGKTLLTKCFGSMVCMPYHEYPGYDKLKYSDYWLLLQPGGFDRIYVTSPLAKVNYPARQVVYKGGWIQKPLKSFHPVDVRDQMALIDRFPGRSVWTSDLLTFLSSFAPVVGLSGVKTSVLSCHCGAKRVVPESLVIAADAGVCPSSHVVIHRWLDESKMKHEHDSGGWVDVLAAGVKVTGGKPVLSMNEPLDLRCSYPTLRTWHRSERSVGYDCGDNRPWVPAPGRTRFYHRVAKALPKLQNPFSACQVLDVGVPERVETAYDNMVEVDTLTPDLPRSEYLLVLMIGSHGDQIPVKWYCRLAAHFGAKVAYYVVKDDDGYDLRKIANGDLWDQIPAFLEIVLSGDAGWRHVYCPFFSTKGRHTVYTLTPSDRWIRPVTFGKTFFGRAAALAAKIGNHEYRIGSRLDSDTGRSCDGHTALVKHLGGQPRTHRYMVTSGSDVSTIIPSECAKYPLLPSGNHSEILKDVETLYCHGGAGTMDTAIMAGCQAVSFGKDLDRRYHRAMGPADARDVGPLPLLFDMMWNSCVPVRKLGWRFCVAGLWANRKVWGRWVAWRFPLFALRVYTLVSLLVFNHLYLLALFLCLEPAFRVFGFRWVRCLVPLACALWEYPLLAFPSPMALLVIFSVWLRKFFFPLLYDFKNASKRAARRQFRWTLSLHSLGEDAGGLGWLPGHMVIRDSREHRFYEGQFMVKGRVVPFAPFEFRETTRDGRGWKPFIELGVNVDERQLKSQVGTKGHYSPRWNCQTLAWSTVHRTGPLVFVPVLAAFVIGGTLLGLWVATSALAPEAWKSMFPDHEAPLLASLPESSGSPGPQDEGEEKIGLSSFDQDTVINVAAEMALVAVEEQGLSKDEAVQVAFDAVTDLTKDLFDSEFPETKAAAHRRKTALSQALDNLEAALAQFFHSPLFQEVVRYFRELGSKMKRLFAPVVRVLSRIVEVAYKFASQVVHCILDAVVTLVHSLTDGHPVYQRLKSVWALGGVLKDPKLSPVKRLAEELAVASYVGSTSFDQDFDEMVEDLKSHYSGDEPQSVGGVQSRPVNLFRRPAMSKQEIELLQNHLPAGTQPTELDFLTERVQRYLDRGTEMGVDGVWVGQSDNERISESLNRYDQDPISLPGHYSDSAWASKIANAICERYPEAMTNAKITLPESVSKYLKMKYSPGSPFIGHYKTRQAMWQAGWGRALISQAYDKLRNGTYPVQFYHAFEKAQVVPGEKLVHGKKNIRTVVAQCLRSYFVSQTAQFERNKRIHWDTTWVGSGMPLNQNMVNIFAAVGRRKVKIASDASEADSRFSPFLFECLAQMASVGMSVPAASIVRAKYEAMQNSYILAITQRTKTGNHPELSKKHFNAHLKRRGGGTGQDATSWDNTWGIKAGFIAAWCDYWSIKGVDKQPSDFFKETDFANTGDDNVWGMDEEMEWDLFTSCASNYGLDLTVDVSSEQSQLMYLGKRSRIPTTRDYEEIMSWQEDERKRIAQMAEHNPGQAKILIDRGAVETPGLVIYQDLKSILLRRTALRWFHQKPDELLRHTVDRSVGHAYLTSFKRGQYAMFQNEWYEDARRYLGRMAYTIQLTPDNYGLNKVVFLNPNQDKKLSDRLATDERFRSKWRYLTKSARYPDYQNVVNAHMRMRIPNYSYSEQLIRKLDRGVLPTDILLREFMDVARHTVTGQIPREFYRFIAGVDMIYPEPIWLTRKQRIEKFTIVSAVNAGKEPTTLSEFVALLREGPFSSCIDPAVFWDKWQDEEFRRSVLIHNDNSRFYWSSIAWWTSILYACMYYVERFIERIPFLGPLYSFVLFTIIDIPRLYAVLNIAYWNQTGRSSRDIGALVPRDPYIHSKRLTLWLLDLVPDFLFYWFQISALFSWVPSFVDEVARLVYTLQSNHPGYDSGKANNDDNEWDEFASDYLEELKTKRRLIISAPTGTGKSTWFLRAIMAVKEKHDVGRLWLLVPRKVLRDEWSYPQAGNQNVQTQVLQRGVILDPRTDIAIMTYGHFIAREEKGEVSTNDLVIMDEFHELSGEMLLSENRLDNRVFLLSATPVSLPNRGIIEVKRPTVKGLGFKRKVFHFDGDVTQAWLELREKDPRAAGLKTNATGEEMARRCLIIVPTIQEVQKVIAGLDYVKPGCRVSELSSRQRVPAPDGIIVATQVADAGLDIKPPVLAVIDSGSELVIDKGVAKIQPSRPATMKQREGRCGRLTDGIVMRPPSAGTGPEASTYPAPQMFQEKIIAQHFDVPLLEHVLPSSLATYPFFKCEFPSDLAVDPGYKRNLELGATAAILAVHAGVNEREIVKLYQKWFILKEDLPEEYDWIRRVLFIPNGWHSGIPRNVVFPSWKMIDWYFLSRNIVWNIGGSQVRGGCLRPQNGEWIDLFAEQPRPVQKKVKVPKLSQEVITHSFDNCSTCSKVEKGEYCPCCKATHVESRGKAREIPAPPPLPSRRDLVSTWKSTLQQQQESQQQKRENEIKRTMVDKGVDRPTATRMVDNKGHYMQELKRKLLAIGVQRVSFD